MNKIIPTQVSKFRPFRRLRKDTASAAAFEDNPLYILWRHQILDPNSDIVTYWNHFFLITSLLALFIDPLYFFVPYVGGPACLNNDDDLKLHITIFRSLADVCYLLHMMVKFRTGFIAPSSKVFGRGELVMDAREIALRYLKSDFIIDFAAMLPLPQIVNWIVIPALSKSPADQGTKTFTLIIVIQYVPRLFLIFPLNQRIIKTSGVVAKTAWVGAVYNLLLYILASHLIGASWYLASIMRQYYCWAAECRKESRVVSCWRAYLHCTTLDKPERQYWLNVTKVIANCDAKNKNTKFRLGMFEDVFMHDVVSADTIDKYLYCLWWGLRNLSSYGQNLNTTTFLGETLFAISICILGLVLFSHLIGNMQGYLQSMTVRLEEWRIKRRDTEEWMRHRQLPPMLQERVRRFVQYKWLATRGVNEESILRSLPLDLRREIQRHLCLALVRRVPFFAQMDNQLLDAICERLVSSLCTQDTYVVREGDPVKEMLFIIRGKLESSTTDGGRSGFYNAINLGPGDFCGEELLTWALMPNSSLNLPLSTRTVKTNCEVEAFALRAEDLKKVANQFKRLHSRKLQHAFRYYSHQWRTWGACYIQAAWRRYKKKKMAKELYIHENVFYTPNSDQDSNYDELQDQNYEDEVGESSSMDNPNNFQHLGATFLASKFAANTRRNQKGQVVDTSASSLKMPKFFKPNEPDFFIDQDDV